MNRDIESHYRCRLKEHGFFLRRRNDGIYEIYKGVYLRMVGDLDRGVDEFIASLHGIDTAERTSGG